MRHRQRGFTAKEETARPLNWTEDRNLTCLLSDSKTAQLLELREVTGKPELFGSGYVRKKIAHKISRCDHIYDLFLLSPDTCRQPSVATE